MGNTSLSNEFKSGMWQTIETIGNREVLENIETQIQVQKHFAMSDFKSFDDRFRNTELYNWRKSLDQNMNIVKLYEFEIKQERFGIQEDQYVYTEKINRLVHKAKTLSKPEAFLLILDLLTGLDILFSTFGLFNIDVFLLGVSQSGKGKVWLNDNYAKNNIDQSNLIDAKNQTTELIIVNNLVRLVRDKVNNGNFMPEIDFPSNIHLKAAIQYIKNIRKEHFLFRVDKVYLNREQFQQHFDMLYQQYLESQNHQFRPQFQNHSQHNQSNLPISKVTQNPQLLQVQPQERRLQRQKSISFLKVKNEPSQTLSSDSNSRSKKRDDKLANLPIEPRKLQNQVIHHHEKINLKNMINKQKISSQLKKEPQNLQTQFIQGGPNFVRNEKVTDHVERPVMFQQKLIFAPSPLQNVQNQTQKILQSGLEENAHLQAQQKPVTPVHQFPPQINEQQFIQRKVVQYRPLNPNERRNMLPISGPIMQPQPNNLPHQKMFVPYNSQPLRPPLSQPLHNVTVSRPLERQNLNLQPNWFKNQLNQDLKETKEQDEQFINNVELCQSVIFDRGEIERNMADL